MGGVYEDVLLASAYQAGNEMPESSLRAWTELVWSHAPNSDAAFLDVGCGTGMFAQAVARWMTPSMVVAVDPSWPMLRQVSPGLGGSAISRVLADASALPFEQERFGLILMSRVIHHFIDLAGCIREAHRVLSPGGVAIARTTFRENLDGRIYDSWPTLRASDESRFLSEASVVSAFEQLGFRTREIASFAQPVYGSLGEFRDRLISRPQSKFAYLTDMDFRAGLDRLNVEVGRVDLLPPQGVPERYDIGVFVRM